MIRMEYTKVLPQSDHIFLKWQAAFVLSIRIATKYKGHKRHNESTVISYCKAISYLLETHATDSLSKKDTNMVHFIQLLQNEPREHLEALKNKSFQYDRVLYEYSYSKRFLLRDYRISSNTVCIHRRISRMALQSSIWCARSRQWRI